MFMPHFVFLFDFLGLVISFSSPLVWFENTEKDTYTALIIPHGFVLILD